MKIKCENLVICGNYNCRHNCEGRCFSTAMALDATGKCVVAQPKIPASAPVSAPTPKNSNAC